MLKSSWHGGTMGERIVMLAADQAEWSQATFGADNIKGPVGSLRHLSKEANEAAEASKLVQDSADENDTVDESLRLAQLMELADCLILILDANRRAGFTLSDLVWAGEQKMGVNKARAWPRVAEWDIGDPYLCPEEIGPDGIKVPAHYRVWANREWDNGRQWAFGNGASIEQCMASLRRSIRDKNDVPREHVRIGKK